MNIWIENSFHISDLSKFEILFLQWLYLWHDANWRERKCGWAYETPSSTFLNITECCLKLLSWRESFEFKAVERGLAWRSYTTKTSRTILLERLIKWAKCDAAPSVSIMPFFLVRGELRWPSMTLPYDRKCSFRRRFSELRAIFWRPGVCCYIISKFCLFIFPLCASRS